MEPKNITFINLVKELMTSSQDERNQYLSQLREHVNNQAEVKYALRKKVDKYAQISHCLNKVQDSYIESRNSSFHSKIEDINNSLAVIPHFIDDHRETISEISNLQNKQQFLSNLIQLKNFPIQLKNMIANSKGNDLKDAIHSTLTFSLFIQKHQDVKIIQEIIKEMNFYKNMIFNLLFEKIYVPNYKLTEVSNLSLLKGNKIKEEEAQPIKDSFRSTIILLILTSFYLKNNISENKTGNITKNQSLSEKNNLDTLENKEEGKKLFEDSTINTVFEEFQQVWLLKITEMNNINSNSTFQSIINSYVVACSVWKVLFDEKEELKKIISNEQLNLTSRFKDFKLILSNYFINIEKVAGLFFSDDVHDEIMSDYFHVFDKYKGPHLIDHNITEIYFLGSMKRYISKLFDMDDISLYPNIIDNQQNDLNIILKLYDQIPKEMLPNLDLKLINMIFVVFDPKTIPLSLPATNLLYILLFASNELFPFLNEDNLRTLIEHFNKSLVPKIVAVWKMKIYYQLTQTSDLHLYNFKDLFTQIYEMFNLKKFCNEILPCKEAFMEEIVNSTILCLIQNYIDERNKWNIPRKNFLETQYGNCAKFLNEIGCKPNIKLEQMIDEN
ncbi:hypothetical protein TRFO_40542 [Tritrichomonas foetus]|uniref:Uncharacterized protein n=1 Tax=Tritrichomonas foetus TaxID=1144522 RepID=A0A1J4J0N5_9EUKA|nr:hypothetical protein TRFO_40542 [Tritrichomonas foetus]|eukprot:OHS93136.1 hypothetical protein TRFO_40542 [Tritrichomonas foetus]